MALRQTYLAIKAKLPKGVEVILVMRGRGNDELAPSEELLDDFNHHKRKFRDGADGYSDAYHYAWEKSNYESKFRNEILSNHKSVKRLKELSELSKEKDVFLVCYEAEDKPCHRKILLKIAEEEFRANVNYEPYFPDSQSQLSLFHH